MSTLPKRICTKIRKAIPLDPRQQFAFVTDLTVRGKAALRDAGMALASVPAIASRPKFRCPEPLNLHHLEIVLDGTALGASPG